MFSNCCYVCYLCDNRVTMFTKKLRKIYQSIILPWVILPVFTAVLLGSNLLTFSIGKAYGEQRLNAFVTENSTSITNKEPTKESGAEKASLDFLPFWKAWYFLEKNFVQGNTSTTTDLITEQERLWGAIAGLAASYNDPYTVFLPPDENKSFEQEIQGEFSGIGAEIALRSGNLIIISPLADSPAEKAGLKPKDHIIMINEIDSRGMSPDRAVTYIRGEKGTPVTLTITREGVSEPLSITIIRDLIKVPTIETEIKDDVFVISLFSFTAKSPGLFRDALQKFIDSGKKKLVLDLRGNPGGFLDAAISMASWFLPKSAIVVTEQYQTDRPDKIHYSKGYNVFKDNLEMVILVDAGSASASEILAGALRDHNRALLVGTNTFGKGSVQELFQITPETSLKVTIAKWLLPSGVHISDDGITPDYVVDIPDDIAFGEDPIMDKAIEILNQK